MLHRLAFLAAVAAVVAGSAACGSDSTSFRPIEPADPNHAGPPSAAYDVQLGGQVVARVHVWSNGGYVSSSDDPMTHVGFEINSATLRPMTFDADTLELIVFDRDGAPLPRARLTTFTPQGVSLITVPPASTALFGAYFLLPIRPRSVGSMQVRWTLRLDGDDYHQVTGFLRDDDARVIEHLPPRDQLWPSS
jgi:hypothetical protein